MPTSINGSTGITNPDGTATAPSIVGSDSDTGIYFPGANRLGFATNGTQTGEFDASGNLKFNSGYGSVATAYGCRAWVNFNGQGTVAIRASANVSSITDNGTGDYTVNFTNATPDANYAIVGTCRGGDSSDFSMEVLGVSFNTAPTTSACRVTSSYSGTGYDVLAGMVTIFR